MSNKLVKYKKAHPSNQHEKQKLSRTNSLSSPNDVPSAQPDVPFAQPDVPSAQPDVPPIIISVLDLKIPETYTKDPTLKRINKVLLESYDAFTNVTYKFSSKFATSKMTKKDMDRGIFTIDTRNPRERYELRVVPVFGVSFDEKKMCWSWNENSFWWNYPYYISITHQFRRQMQKYLDEMPYLRFDCVENTDNDKFFKLQVYMMGIARYELNAYGYIVLWFEDDEDTYETEEYCLITEINQINVK